MLRSVVTKTSKPAASAASSNSPFRSVSQPRERASSTAWPVKAAATLSGSHCRTRRASARGCGRVETSGSELKHSANLIPRYRELFDHFVNRQAVLEVLENNRDWRPGASEHPRAADVAGN